MSEQIKVSQLLEASSVDENDYVMIIQNGINKKVKASEIGTGGGGGDTLPIGTIIQWDFDTLPNNWLWTDHEYLIADYPQLYAICGTKYNTNSTPQGYFRTPNRAGLIAIGAGTHTDTNGDSKTFVLGQEYGEYEHTLSIAEMPEHRHDFENGNGTSIYPATMRNGGSNELEQISGSRTYDQLVNSKAGGSQSHNNIQPSIATNFIIKARQSAGVSASVIQEDGTPNETDVYSSEAVDAKIEVLKGDVLYEDETGTLGNVTLSDNAENYDYIEIFYRASGRSGSLKVQDIANKELTLPIIVVSSSTFVSLVKSIRISNTTITKVVEAQYLRRNNGTEEFTTMDSIYIYKVVGYKY